MARVAEAARAGAVHASANLTRQPTDGNPLRRSVGARRRRRPRHEVRADAGPHAHGDRQPGLRPGRSRSRGRQPDGVRDVLLRAPAVLRRRLRHFSFDLDCNDGACTGCSIRAAIGRAPQGIDDLPSGDDVYTDAPAQTTILGAAQADRAASASSRSACMHAVTQEETGDASSTALGASQQPVEPLDRATRSAASRREFANQSSIGFMLTATNRQLATARSTFLPDSALHRRRRLRLRVQEALQRSPATGSAAASTATPEAIDAHAGEQPPLLPAARLRQRRRSTRRARRSTARAGAIGDQQDRRRARPLQLATFVQVARASTSTTSASCAAPTSASMSNWLQIRSDKPNRWFRSRNINFNQCAGWNFDGDRLVSGGNVNAHVDVRQQLVRRRRHQRATRRASTIARRAAARASTSRAITNVWSWLNTDNRRPRVAERSTAAAATATGVVVPRHRDPSVTLPADAGADGHDRRARQPRTSTTRSGSSNVTDATRPLRLRPPRPDDGRAHRALQLHDDAEPVAAALRASRSSRPATTTASRSWPTAAASTTPRATRRTPTTRRQRQSRLQREVVPDDQRAALGIQAGLDAVRRLAAGARERRGARRLPLRPRLARIFGVPPNNVFLVKLAYWLNY